MSDEPLSKPNGNGNGDTEDAKAFVRVLLWLKKHWVAGGMITAFGMGVFGMADKTQAVISSVDPIQYALMKKDVDDLKTEMKELKVEIKEMTRAMNRVGVFARGAGGEPGGGRFRESTRPPSPVGNSN